MRNVGAVNRWVGIAGLVLCLLLAVLALPGWWYLRHAWVSGDAIVRSRVLRPGLMVYVIRREGGGAPARDRYDYYLSGRFVDRSTLGGLMDRRAPFLVADNDMADIVVDGDDTLCVALIGHVFGFQNRVVVDIAGVRHPIAIGLAARPGGGPDDPSARRLAEAIREASRAASAGPNGQSANDRAGGAPSVCRMLP